MSDIETQIGGLLSLAEAQLKTSAQQQHATNATLAELKAQIASFAALGPKLTAGVKEDLANGARAAVLETSGDLKSAMVQFEATVATADKDLVGSVSKFRKGWSITLFAAAGAFVALMILTVICAGWWDRFDVERLQARKEALQADVATLEAHQTDFERRGRRLVWTTCGGRPCFEVSPKDPGTWQTNGIRLAVPLETH